MLYNLALLLFCPACGIIITVMIMKSPLIRNEIGKDPMYKIWHASSRALFLYVHSGTGSVVTKDRSYPIEKNALILIAPGTYHYTMPDEPDAYVRSKLFLSSAKFAGIGELLQAQSLLRSPVIFARIPPEAREVVDGIYTEAAACESMDTDAPLLLSCALRLVFYLNKYATEGSSTAVGFLSKAIQYINENIASELDLDSICAAISVSKYYFCRQFKLQLGMTVMQYILNTRIILAKDALEKTDSTISQISQGCGFSSVSYFCQAFKTETGSTPLQYRKQKRGGS